MRIGFQINDIRDLDCEVLVVCSTYNHEKYLSDALDGFVSQITSFPFLVLVHDDASTDGTANVIRDYESRFPNIIKGIYDEENQYQQGLFFWYLDYLRNSKAKYIALCEGDDYWASPDKLAMQYEALEKDGSLSYCFTNAVKMDANTRKTLGKMLPAFPAEERILRKRVLGAEDLLRLAFIPTASFFSRKDAWLSQPVLPKEAFQGDRAHQIYLSLSGDALYLDEVTSVYRVNNGGSLVGSWVSSNQKYLEILNSYIELYKCFDRDSNGAFHDDVQDAIDVVVYDEMLISGDKTALPPRKAMAVANRRGLGEKCKYLLFRISPKLYLSVRKWGKRFSGKVSANG